MRFCVNVRVQVPGSNSLEDRKLKKKGVNFSILVLVSEILASYEIASLYNMADLSCLLVDLGDCKLINLNVLKSFSLANLIIVVSLLIYLDEY